MDKLQQQDAREQLNQYEVPVLDTERLRLRDFRQSDFADYLAMVSDPDVVRYVGQGEPLAPEPAWQSMAYLMGHWWLKGFGLWAVEEKASGRVIGRVGLYQPEGWPGMELGWMIAKEHWRKGFAFEAAQAALAYQRAHFSRESLISLIHSENKPSVRLAQKLGAVFSLGREMGDIQVLEFSYPVSS
ncbi:MAG: GNAT family N-acetyltransferase [Oceanospirillum sp.]|nr:GNAT family N-acetyltransferase [Oceanospirillum sp.]